MTQDPDRRQQHDEQEKEQQPFQLLSPQPDDAKEIVFLDVDDDVSSAISPSSSTHIGDDDINNNKNNHNQGNSMMSKQKRNKVVSFRLSEAEYARYLSMAKVCHENGLTNKPDIVSYIRLSMECLWKYIISQAQKDHSTAIELQKKKEGEGEVLEKHDQHQAMIRTTQLQQVVKL